MGDSFDIDEKIMRLSNMLPSLVGKSGTLDMTDFSEDEDTFSFEMDKGGLDEIFIDPKE